MPFRTALSLKALMAWVTKSGRKLRDFRIANWLCVWSGSPLICLSVPMVALIIGDYVRPVTDHQTPKTLS
jgi:hypothetical protein